MFSKLHRKLQHKQSSKKTSNYSDYDHVGYDSTERYPRSVLKYAQDKQKSSLHPTQKPLALIRYLIKTFSNENEIVFDGYMGSGTTAVGCIKERRHFLGTEKKETEYLKAQKRILQTLKTPELILI